MYVDESGDPGIHQYGSPYFILSGIIVPEQEWAKYLDRLKQFRKSIKTRYGLRVREELHASELIRVKNIEAYKNIRKSDRIQIMREYCHQLPVIFDTAKIIGSGSN